MSSPIPKTFSRIAILALAVAGMSAIGAGTASAADCDVVTGLPTGTNNQCLTAFNNAKPPTSYTATVDTTSPGCADALASGCIPVRSTLKSAVTAGSYATGYTSTWANRNNSKAAWIRANCTPVTGGYTCTSAQDPAATVLNQWQRCDVSRGDCSTNNAGFTNTTGTGAWYTLTTADVGYRLRNQMDVTTNGGANGKVKTQDTVGQGNFAPVAVHCNGACVDVPGQGSPTRPPTLSGGASVPVGTPMQLSPGFWQGVQAGSSFQYAFQRCTSLSLANDANASCTDIAGTSGWYYKPVAADKTDGYVRGKVTLSQTVGTITYTIIAYTATKPIS